MIDPHAAVDSADQDQWTEFSAKIRTELARRADTIKEMDIDDFHSFICCCREAQQQELFSRVYDQKLQRLWEL